jgi:phosphoglycolate phosphatase-like HAD superfamily hydrolase
MLIFDFDGVLINSLDEIVLTAYNAATGSLMTALAEVPLDLVQMFKNNRFHVQTIGDAIVVMNWCLVQWPKDPQKILTRPEYQAMVRGSDVALTDRTNLIYATRKRFIDHDIKRWLALHQTYQPLWDELSRLKNYPFVILTNKNHDATLRLCRHFGLAIDAEDIYSGDNGVTKIENMLQIQKRFGRQPFLFIDDSVKNLQALDRHFNRDKKVLALGLAAWGYLGAGDTRSAPQAGYPVFQQTDVVQFLNSAI